MADDEVEAFVEDEAYHDEDEGPGWNWWLIVIPIVAVLTFVLVLLYGANVLVPADLGADVELWHIVVAGVVVLAVLLIVEIVLLVGRHPEHLEDEEEPAPQPEVVAARREEAPDLEALATDDEVDGKKVLEVARPPKGAVEAGVYATTYVDLDNSHVLRLEEIVALRP